MAPNYEIRGLAYSLPVDNIDTDQIIPARFLTTTSRDGLGAACFHDWRYRDDGSERADHPLRAYRPGRHPVLVTGHNFGCGSSREHAPWALLDFGVRAVISTRFADIFRANALKNGLLPVTAPARAVEFLHQAREPVVEIDVAGARLYIPGCGEFSFPIDPFSAYCLTRGMDPLDFILSNDSEITRYEQTA